MNTEDVEICFGPYRLCRRQARLLRDGRPVPLTPKAMDVLHHLARRPGELVGKQELLAGVWPDVIVGDASVKVCIREIRQALGDSADEPKYIQTVHRRGYRFIGEVISPAGADATKASSPPGVAQSVRPHPHLHPVVGRETELAELSHRLACAAAGQRQTLFVTGEIGTGKTALVEAFVHELEASTESSGPTTVAVGNCFERFGPGEPYLPVWEAIGRIPVERRPGQMSALLARHATPATSTTSPAKDAGGDDDDDDKRTRPTASSVRILRDMIDAFESFPDGAGTLVLILEDLHWADYSTLDLITGLARRRSPARLMVIGTYRPTETTAGDHPLRAVVRDLRAARLASELPLDALDELAVARYVARQFPASPLPAELAARLYQRTGGHPLFLVHLVDDLVDRGVLAQRDGAWSLDGQPGADWAATLDAAIPATVRAMVEVQLSRLQPRELQVLEAAAVAGSTFPAALAAATLASEDVGGTHDDGGSRGGDDDDDANERRVLETEEICETLVDRHRLLARDGVAEWADGTVATRYRFVHDLHHEIAYASVAAARRARLHRVAGIRLESAWAPGPRPTEHAAELASHFERGRDWPRALAHLRHAADAAARQYAHREAVDYLRRASRALDLLPPDSPERVEHEFPLLMSLGVHLQLTLGCAHPDVEAVHARAQALTRAAPIASAADIAAIYPVLWSIWVFRKVRSELAQASELADQLLSLAKQTQDPALLLQAHQSKAVTALCQGDPSQTRRHAEEAEALSQLPRATVNARVYGQDPRVACLSFGAVALQVMDESENAAAASARAIAQARELRHAYTLALSLHFAAMRHQIAGDASAAERSADEAVQIASCEGYPFWAAGSTILRGWARAVGAKDPAGVDEIRCGLAQWLATGSRTYQPYFLGLLADALLATGSADEALGIAKEGVELAASLSEGFYAAELHHLHGQSLLRSKAKDPTAIAEAEACFHRGLAIARQQKAASFARRIEASLTALGSPPLAKRGRNGVVTRLD